MTKTSSIYMTAAFLALGAKLEEIDKTDPRHMIFTLSDLAPVASPIASTATVTFTNVDNAISDNNLVVWEKAWANGTLMVNAVKYMEAIQRLKSIIHSV